MFNKNNHLKVYVAAGDSFASTGSSEINYEKNPKFWKLQKWIYSVKL
jgi:hypothetical protein